MVGPSARYAKALLEALESSGSLDAALPVLASLASLPTDLVALLGNPAVPASARSAALETALGHPSKESVMGRLVSILTERRRLGLVSEIASQTIALHESRSGVVRGTVESRTPISKDALQTLERTLSTEGRRVELAARIDDSIIGGFRARLGDVLLDATANNQLSQARRALLSA
ncbi:MAG: ATP synthase F1 subunit delta [Fibrobacteria bacterium]|nr:ATP synthase F1 subunit delta [Fibrobacteria bacterium]